MKLTRFAFVAFWSVSALPQRLITVPQSKLVADKVTNDVTSTEQNAFGSCTCDITFNSCDAYCCCDLDCDAKVRDAWNAKPDIYCAKNLIGAEYKPQQKCVDSGQIYAVNKRMGMKVTETEK